MMTTTRIRKEHATVLGNIIIVQIISFGWAINSTSHVHVQIYV